MSYATIEHQVGTESLVVHKCWCGLSHAIPKSLHRMAVENQKSVFCPLGHSWSIRESEVDRLKKRLSLEERKLCGELARHDQTREELRATERRRQAQKAATTRLVNRVSRGVCPCCKRSFGDLRRHMKTKHPHYAEGSKR